MAISSQHFYENYYGHTLDDLYVLLPSIHAVKGPDCSIIYLAGDSSLDNKCYVTSRNAPSVNGYEAILDPPRSKRDVAYWLNYLLVERGLGDRMVAVNTAVEESSIGSRARGKQHEQDTFIRQHFKPEKDVLVISLGGNDIALAPTCCTIVNMILLLKCNTTQCLQDCACGKPLPCDDYCCGCCCGCCSNALAFPCGYGYFLHLFGTRVAAIANRLSSPDKPQPAAAENSPSSGVPQVGGQVLVSMIYYVDEAATGGWADRMLSVLGYDREPAKLQTLTRRMFEDATSKIKLKNQALTLVPVPFFQALDGKCSSDYVQRVEPSEHGGKKLAALILDKILARGHQSDPASINALTTSLNQR